MKNKYKVYWRINLLSLFFIILSFISVTLAWFAYSGLSNVSTEIGVKAWYITLEKDGEMISNDIVISSSEIYPGMETLTETVKIQNLGDSDANIRYSILSARILDQPENNFVVNDKTVTSDYVEDQLSHSYPFKVNINLSKGYVLAKGDESFFEVSISWPLDSGDDGLDSYWGSEAFKFQQSETNRKSANPEYQKKQPIQIVISVIAEQDVGDENSNDPNFNLGDQILFDVINNKSCKELSETCISTYVIDSNNKIANNKVTLLPTPRKTYLSGIYSNYNSLLKGVTSDWNVETRALYIEDILNVISTDIFNSKLLSDEITGVVIGDLKYPNRIQTEIEKVKSTNGYYNFRNEKFQYISTANCYWINSRYNSSKSFAIKRVNEEISKVYGLDNNSTCNVVPVITVDKNKIKQD